MSLSDWKHWEAIVTTFAITKLDERQHMNDNRLHLNSLINILT